MTSPSFEDLYKELARNSLIRRIYLVERRADDFPDTNYGVMLAVEVPEATPKQWDDILRTVNESGYKFESGPIRLESAPQALREDILANGTIVFDQSDSPVSPT